MADRTNVDVCELVDRIVREFPEKVRTLPAREVAGFGPTRVAYIQGLTPSPVVSVVR